ncbi:MAG: hypothetical protein SFZ24_02530 [Planctomycetota bacterium]|nr:hypothetical protein [Planctomycetota bacterium]
MSLRETLEEKPWIGWAVAGVLALVGLVLIARAVIRPAPAEQLASEILIRFQDTGDTQRMNRGMFEKQMLSQSAIAPLDPAVGINNPKTNKPTGFPEDAEYWQRLVADINAARAAANQRRGTDRPSQ